MRTINIVAVVLASCFAHAADIPLSKGFGGVSWGDKAEQIGKAYPKLFGLIKGKNGDAIYLVKPGQAFIVKGGVVEGCFIGDGILNYQLTQEIGVNQDRGGTQSLGGGLSRGMSFKQAMDILNPGVAIKPDYRATVTRDGVEYKLSFSSQSGVEGDDKFHLYEVMVMRDESSAGSGGLDAEDVKKLF
jgi:hypothetical protein